MHSAYSIPQHPDHICYTRLQTLCSFIRQDPRGSWFQRYVWCEYRILGCVNALLYTDRIFFHGNGGWRRSAEVLFGSCNAALGRSVALQQKILTSFNSRFPSHIGHDPQLINSHEAPPGDYLTSNQILAKRWFQLCSSTHSRCKPKSRGTNFPTRLLDLDACETHASVRVTVTDTNPREGEYMTLSHCWGAAQFIKLQRSNIEELSQGIQLSELPRTFQDAVAVAKWFKVRYLWIDSLCILQDCKEDWLKESAVMRDIYRHSTMNISATGAADSTVGCFLDRNADKLRPFNVLLSDLQSKELKYICFDVQCWYLNVSNAPLSRRAWVFQ